MGVRGGSHLLGEFATIQAEQRLDFSSEFLDAAFFRGGQRKPDFVFIGVGGQERTFMVPNRFRAVPAGCGTENRQTRPVSRWC